MLTIFKPDLNLFLVSLARFKIPSRGNVFTPTDPSNTEYNMNIITES